MISKQRIKFIKSLQFKKYRTKTNSFIVEGEKSVLEVLQSDFRIRLLYCTEKFQINNQAVLSNGDIEIIQTDEKSLQGIGSFKTNDQAVAIVKMQDNLPFEIGGDDYILALDAVQDPGNLGTIIRTADWFGINKILASNDTVDLYNPKVISSTKGSFTRVKLYYCDLVAYLKEMRVRLIGTAQTGVNLVDANIKPPAVIVLGSESKGISIKMQQIIDEMISIPRSGHAESLNVAIANGIICHQLAKNKTC